MGIAEYIRRVLVVGLIILTGGCSGGNGKNEPQYIERIHLQLQADSNINPNDYSAGNPVRIIIYQLRSMGAFLFSDYSALVNQPDREVIEQMNVFYDGVISPGERRIVTVPVSQDILALGVVTVFQDIQRANWKSVYSVSSNTGNHSVGERAKKEKYVLVTVRDLTTTLEPLE
ncbi:type VI secretion system lipoprotein TssJ [Enterobacteriaceae bacterium 4M9]|nr:type VI secretion system lipoprotein TssJ [Enterobacteriaceae bacterium 4M9]